jgi:hypothetical protein
MYVSVGGSRELNHAAQLTRYYPTLVRPAEDMVVHGKIDAIAERVAAYAEAGLDRLILARPCLSCGRSQLSQSTSSRR